MSKRKLGDASWLNNEDDIKAEWVPSHGMFHARDNRQHCDVYMSIYIENQEAHIQGVKISYDHGYNPSYGDLSMCKWLYPTIEKATGTKRVFQGPSRLEKLQIMLDTIEVYFNSDICHQDMKLGKK